MSYIQSMYISQIAISWLWYNYTSLYYLESHIDKFPSQINEAPLHIAKTESQTDKALSLSLSLT